MKNRKNCHISCFKKYWKQIHCNLIAYVLVNFITLLPDEKLLIKITSYLEHVRKGVCI